MIGRSAISASVGSTDHPADTAATNPSESRGQRSQQRQPRSNRTPVVPTLIGVLAGIGIARPPALAAPAEGPRRRSLLGLGFLVALVLLLSLAPTAGASVQFDLQVGERRFRGRPVRLSGRRRHRLLGQRLRRRPRATTGSRSSTPPGTFLTKWGSFGSGDGQFNEPDGVAIDASGNVYVADTGNNRIQKFDSSRHLPRPSGAATAPATASSATRRAWPPTPRATSTSPTPATTGSRSSTPPEPT